MAVRLSTQRVWHTFNYDVTVSNGVNLCHPLSGRGPQGVHASGMAVASGWAVVGFKLARVLFRRLNIHMNSYV